MRGIWSLALGCGLLLVMWTKVAPVLVVRARATTSPSLSTVAGRK